MAAARRWLLFRSLLLSGLALVGYPDPLAHPPAPGSLQEKIFPLALLRALSGIALAGFPSLLERAQGRIGMACRGALTAFGGVWMGAEEVRPVRVGSPILGVAGD